MKSRFFHQGACGARVGRSGVGRNGTYRAQNWWRVWPRKVGKVAGTDGGDGGGNRHISDLSHLICVFIPFMLSDLRIRTFAQKAIGYLVRDTPPPPLGPNRS